MKSTRRMFCLLTSRKNPISPPKLDLPTNLNMPRLAIFLTALVLCIPGPRARAQSKPEKDYLIYVLAESADKIALVRFGPKGARVDHDLKTGNMPIDINRPHGSVISPDQQF